MIPSAVVVLPEFPLTPNGKVDRRALPAPAGQPMGAEFIAPRTPLEVELAALMADLLQVEAVGLTANFFELGGHSLKAMQLIARVRERFGVELSVRTLFEHPTVAGLTAKMEERLVPPASDLEALLAELEQLSPEEQAQLLAALETEGVNS
jgi:acyl carrier protein